MAILDFLTLAICLEVLAAALVVWVLYLTFRYIPNNRVGIVEKLFSWRGSVTHGLIALEGEAGYQPELLRGGWHLLMPFQYRVHTVPLVTIPQGKIGYIFARDGRTLDPGQALGSNVTANDFQDAAAFLRNAGQRGPQRQILREGTYAINLAQFVVITEDGARYLPFSDDEIKIFRDVGQLIASRNGFQPIIIQGSDDQVGIVTIHDGPSLPQGELIAPGVGDDPADAATYHNLFQSPEQFLAAGGRRGRQLQVLVDGTYYVNRLFATIELIPKTVVDVGSVGVIVSYTGDKGIDLSGTDYKHGEMVETGKRGVWNMPLLPGKYAFNTYAGRIVMVPTTNIILKWIQNEAGAHRLDENLAEVSLITKDAFEPTLPLSVVVHIDYRKAPLVIQRFGDIKRLVEQTLDPMVSAYFKNIGQTRTLIQLLQDRSQIQTTSADEMRLRFAEYNLELQEVLIGTPSSRAGDTQIETILRQLRDRQVAEEQVETFARQQKASVQERELKEAEARAKQQQSLTESELSITIQANQGKAEYQRSVQEAERIRALAQAESDRVRLVSEGEASRVRALAEAEAEKAARIGIAQALAIDEQVRAYGGPRFQLTQQVMNRFAEAIETAHVDIVPRILIGGGASNGSGSPGLGGGQGNLIEGLLAMLMSERLGDGATNAEPRSPEADRLRKDLKSAIASKPPRST